MSGDRARLDSGLAIGKLDGLRGDINRLYRVGMLITKSNMHSTKIINMREDTVPIAPNHPLVIPSAPSSPPLQPA